MSAFNILTITIGVLILLWAIRFMIRLVQYVRSGEYETDQRLRFILRWNSRYHLIGPDGRKHEA